MNNVKRLASWQCGKPGNDWIYENNDDNTERYVLAHFFKSRPHKILLCIGVNPSTATPEKLDPTLKSLELITEKLDYDGWCMFNLSSQRSTDPNGMRQASHVYEDNENISYFKKALKKFSKYNIDVDICAAWGNLIDKRAYLTDNLLSMYKIAAKEHWVSFCSMKEQEKIDDDRILTVKGNPRHLLPLHPQSKKIIKNHLKINEYIELKTKKYKLR